MSVPSRAQNVATESQARRAAQVSILKSQFRKSGGFNEEQLSGFFTLVTLGKEVDDDLKKGIARTTDYYRMRRASLNDYFHQEFLSRPTLLSEKDAALMVWKASLIFTPLKLVRGGDVVADAANSSVQALASIYSKEFNPAKAIRNEDLIRNYQSQASQKLGNLLYNSFGKCDQSPASCQAFEELMRQVGGPSQLDPSLTFNQLGAQYPENIPQSMRVANDGLLHYDAQAQASGAMALCLDLTRNAIQPDRQALKHESDPQVNGGFVPVVRGSDPLASLIQADEQRLQTRAAQIEVTLKAVDFSSQLIGLVNPKLANQVETVKQATVSTAQNVSGYLSEVRRFKSLGSSASIADTLKLASSSFSMVSGLVGVGFQIFSMFGDSGPTADQIILQQIQELSNQIEGLRTEMHGRFDRIDSALNDMMNTLHERFGQIDYNQRVIIGNINDIRTELITIQAKLDRLEQYLSRWLQDTQKDEFARNVNGCLDYKSKFGVDMPQNEFIRCETFFYTWVTSTALRDLWAGTDRTDFSDAGIADNVNNYPLSVNINWLSRFLARNLGLPVLSSSVLPNAFEWSLGTQAYLQLMREWPQYAATVSPSRLDDIERLGQGIQQAIANGPTAGANASTPSPLFDALIAKYRDKIKLLRSSINTVEQNYINDPSNKVIDPAGRLTLNIWGSGASQTTSWRPSLTTSGITSISLGGALAARIPDRYAVAQVLGFDQLSSRITDISWVDPQTISTSVPPSFCEGFLGGRRQDVVAKIQVTLELRFGGAVIWRGRALPAKLYHKEFLGFFNCPGTTFPPAQDNPITYVQQDWQGLFEPILVAAPSELSAQEQSAQANLTSSVIAQIEEVLRNHQRAIYARTLAEISAAGEVHASARQLGGMKGLLFSYASLLMPRTLEENEYVRGLLSGDQSILGDTDVAAIYAKAQNAPIPDTTQKVDFSTTAEYRISALQDALSAILAKMAQDHKTEHLDMVSDLLDYIQLYKIGVSGIASCRYGVQPTFLQVPAGGGTVSVAVDADVSCPWKVTGLPSWVHANASGSGPGLATVSVDQNSTRSDRSAVITVAEQSVTITQPPLTPSAVSEVSGSGVYNGTVTLKATLTSGAAPLSNKIINFTLNGSVFANNKATTDASGVATLPNVSLSGFNAGIYPNAVGASFADDTNIAGSSSTGTLSVGKAVAAITLGDLSQIYDGVVKGATATTNPAGKTVVFSYSQNSQPVASPTNAGSYNVSAAINDANYQGSAAGTLVINKAAPVITWGDPADITFGTALGDAQCNATASTPGNLTYNPAQGTVLNAGSNQLLTVSLTPTDGANYNTATKRVSINVLKANQTITFGALANKTFGDPDFSVSATASSGLGLNFEASGQCAVTGNIIHITGAGSCTATAFQAGDSNYSAVAGVPQSFQIAKAVTATAVFSSANPSASAQGVTFTTTIKSAAGVPTGSVQFKADGNNLGGAVNCTAGAGNSCTARVSTSGLSAGAHTITADYSGDSNFSASSGMLSGGQVVAGGIEFSQPLYTVGERGGSVTITVRRTGDTTSAMTVDYATDDGSIPSLAAPCSSVTGIALERCDYTRASGTLRFAAGDTQVSFVVLVNDDSYTEGPETLRLVLSNPTGGAVIGQQSSATLEITDDSPESAVNPVDDEAFVRQHYHDFLNREPDAPGLKFWTDNIGSCGDDQQCREVKRVDTSAAFFLSIEFQETGYLVHRIYKAAYGDVASTNVPGTVPVIRLQEFVRDAQKIGQGVQVGIGNWQQQLEDNKNAFALDFVRRQRFTTAYPAMMTADEFVTKLDQNAGGALSADERAQLIATIGSSPADVAKRAQVLRSVAESQTLRQREFDRAFVLMQYFGYLRRNPDDAPDGDFRGWKFWLDKLDRFGGNFRSAEMVKAFISSTEYRQRFGQ